MTCQLVIEVERPRDLPATATHDLARRDLLLPIEWEALDNDEECALQWLIQPELLVQHLDGVAFVEGTWRAEALPPPDVRKPSR